MMDDEGETAQAEEFNDDSTSEEQAEAKSLGWKSPKEWKGDPPKNGFQSARDYIERGNRVLPIIRSQNAKLEVQLAQANKRLEDFKQETAKTYENLHRMSAKALKAQRETLESKFDASIAAAAEVGDKDQVKALRKEEREALKEFDESTDTKITEKKVEADQLPPAIEDWVKENTWFNDDEEMRALAITHHGKLLREKKGLTLEQNLDEVRKYVAKRFPEAFEVEGEKVEEDDDKPVRRGSPVEGGSRTAGAGSRSIWSRIPADAQKQADRFIKEDGLFLLKGETSDKDLQKARDRYAAEYLGDDK